ncbi:hypothetical protein [Rohdeia mirabilis]|uniref:hypothetical protein n=1 Tax=Rohdeia mirabilis TaxID=2528008 RepID=UPI003AF3991C
MFTSLSLISSPAVVEFAWASVGRAAAGSDARVGRGEVAVAVLAVAVVVVEPAARVRFAAGAVAAEVVRSADFGAAFFVVCFFAAFTVEDVADFFAAVFLASDFVEAAFFAVFVLAAAFFTVFFLAVFFLAVAFFAAGFPVVGAAALRVTFLAAFFFEAAFDALAFAGVDPAFFVTFDAFVVDD